MSANLPPGIFLKVAESRCDAMKFLIIGPKDTPYAGGLFWYDSAVRVTLLADIASFDMFFDEKYPATPPLIKYVTEDDQSGGYSINPNLHVGGAGKSESPNPSSTTLTVKFVCL